METVNKAKIFAVWFLLGTGLILSACFIYHSLNVFIETNLWWWNHIGTMLPMLVLAGGIFVGLAAISINRLFQAKSFDSGELDLHDFISHSLTQTLSGIRAANDKETKLSVTGDTTRRFLLKPGVSTEAGSGIEFDIAVTSKHESGTKGSGKISIHVANGEIGKTAGSAHEQVSRMRFKVFINSWTG